MDGFFKVTDKTKNETIFTDGIENVGLTCMFYISEWLFIGTIQGTVLVYCVSNEIYREPRKLQII